MSEEYLLLKWGTLKGWNLGDNETALAAAKRFAELGMTASAMAQEMSPAHIDALCDMIDAINGPITNDWSGEQLTKEAAKEYVRSYRTPSGSSPLPESDSADHLGVVIGRKDTTR